MGDLGFMGMMVSPAYNGGGMDTISYAIAMEEISRVDASASVIMSVNNSLVCYLLEKYGSELAVDGLPRIILLMDWDRTGDVLQESFNNRLSSMDMKVDQTLRNVLSKQLRSECRTVESISSIESLLEILSLL